MEQLTQYIAIAMPLIMAAANRIRGGWFGNTLKGKGDVLIAFLVGLLFFAITSNPIVGVAVALAYFVGELFSWGQWISAVPHFWDKSWQGFYNSSLIQKKDGQDSGIRQIVGAVIDEKKNFTNYCIACLTLRGIWWWAPVYVVLASFAVVSIPVANIAVIAMGIMFPISYIIGAKISKEDFWPTGEVVYGAAQGAIIAASLLLTF